MVAGPPSEVPLSKNRTAPVGAPRPAGPVTTALNVTPAPNGAGVWLVVMPTTVADFTTLIVATLPAELAHLFTSEVLKTAVTECVPSEPNVMEQPAKPLASTTAESTTRLRLSKQLIVPCGIEPLAALTCTRKLALRVMLIVAGPPIHPDAPGGEGPAGARRGQPHRRRGGG